MSEGYRRRQVRPLFPEIPDSLCDCALLPKEYCCQREDLVHTKEVANDVVDAALEGGKRHITYTRLHLRCPMCAQIWWLYSREHTDLTYSRDDECQVVGSVTYSSSQAVRCRDDSEAAMLDAWWPRYLAALDRRDRLFAASAGAASEALLATMHACIALVETSEATRMLGESSVRACKLAEHVRREQQATMARCIAALEAQPDDGARWDELRSCQRRCAEARLADPARELGDWTAEEWWTPALAGVRSLEFDIHTRRHAARGKTLGSTEHLALREVEDEIARRWMRHLERVQWPHPDCAFTALFGHAQTLEPLVVAGDMASWAHPDRIGRRLRDLLAGGQVRPTRHIEAATWLAARTGLPDARERYLVRAAANYWLPIRRARRRA